MENVRKNSRFCTYCEKKIAPSEKHDKKNCPKKIKDELRKKQEA